MVTYQERGSDEHNAQDAFSVADQLTVVGSVVGDSAGRSDVGFCRRRKKQMMFNLSILRHTLCISKNSTHRCRIRSWCFCWVFCYWVLSTRINVNYPILCFEDE
jgi:hypothetical protein